MEFVNEQLSVEISAFVDRNNTVWFRGKDVASSLGYARPRNAILDHVDDEYKITSKELGTTTKGEQPHAIWISELGVYSLIFSAKMATKKPFEKYLLSRLG